MKDQTLIILLIYIPILLGSEMDSSYLHPHAICIRLSLWKRYDFFLNHEKSETRITFRSNIRLLHGKLFKKSNLYSDKMGMYVLGRKDSNLRIAGPKPVALPLGHAPFRFRFNINKLILVLVVRQFGSNYLGNKLKCC